MISMYYEKKGSHLVDVLTNTQIEYSEINQLRNMQRELILT